MLIIDALARLLSNPVIPDYLTGIHRHALHKEMPRIKNHMRIVIIQ
jgi:hypothetical protein